MAPPCKMYRKVNTLLCWIPSFQSFDGAVRLPDIDLKWLKLLFL